MDSTGNDAICIHDPYEELPASQCVICNGGIKKERAEASAKVWKRSRGTVSKSATASAAKPTERVAGLIE